MADTTPTTSIPTSWVPTQTIPPSDPNSPASSPPWTDPNSLNPSGLSTSIDTNTPTTSITPQTTFNTTQPPSLSVSTASFNSAATHGLNTTVITSSITPSSTSVPLVGTSDQALAGAIVGSILGTAICTLLVAFLFARRARRLANQEYKNESQHNIPNSTGDNKGSNVFGYGHSPPPKQKAPQNSAQGGLNLQELNPNPSDDETIRTRLLTLFDQIALHVDNYYCRTKPIMPLLTEQVSGYDSPYLPQPVHSLLSHPENYRAVITHCLARMVILGTLPSPGGLIKNSDSQSFLPLPFGFYSQNLEAMHDSATEQKLFSWRMLTAHLYQQNSLQNSAFAEIRDRNISKAVDDFVAAFVHHADPKYESSHRAHHLKKVLEAAAQTGEWLFSQSPVFQFTWESANFEDGKPVVVTQPAVAKIFDENGRRLSNSQKMLDAVTMLIKA